MHVGDIRILDSGAQRIEVSQRSDQRGERG